VPQRSSDTRKHVCLMGVSRRNERKKIQFPPFGIEVTPISTERTSQFIQNVMIPNFSLNDLVKHADNKAKISQELATDLYNWLGCISCGVIDFLEGKPLDSYLTQFSNKYTEKGHIFVSREKGFLTPEYLLYQLNMLRRDVKCNKFPWAILNVWGFEDSPVSWNKNEHNFFHSGENNYTFVILPDDKYLLYIAVGAQDTYS